MGTAYVVVRIMDSDQDDETIAAAVAGEEFGAIARAVYDAWDDGTGAVTVRVEAAAERMTKIGGDLQLTHVWPAPTNVPGTPD